MRFLTTIKENIKKFFDQRKNRLKYPDTELSKNYVNRILDRYKR